MLRKLRDRLFGAPVESYFWEDAETDEHHEWLLVNDPAYFGYEEGHCYAGDDCYLCELRALAQEAEA